MNEENFKKGIKELKNIRMTSAEKRAVLEKVFSSPVESPYMERIPVFAVVTSHHARIILTGCLVAALSFSGVVYGSDRSLPGDLLYPVKTNFVEPVLDAVNHSPERKIVWEEEKIDRRIVEAEKLIEKDELDDEKLEKLEKSIEKSSFAFTKAADSVASSTGTSTLSRKKKAEDLKREFRGRISDRRGAFDIKDDEEKVESSDEASFGVRVRVEDAEKILNELDDDRNSKKERINRLKNAAIKVIDEDDDSDEDEDNSDDDFVDGVKLRGDGSVDDDNSSSTDDDDDNELEVEIEVETEDISI
ncbi:MAG: DUF5667 domain-containing protein [Patescibacteria group bacterium]